MLLRKCIKLFILQFGPNIKKLIEQSYEDEKERQMIKDMIENGEIKFGEEGQSSEGEPLPLDQLPDDLKEELKKKYKEKLDYNVRRRKR